jgi:hypothetical protein
LPQASPILSNKPNLLNQSGASTVSPQLQRPNQMQGKPLVGPGGQKIPINQANALNRTGLTPQQQQQKGLVNSSPAASPSAFNATSNNLQQNRSANNNSPFNSISNNKSKKSLSIYCNLNYWSNFHIQS